MLHCHDSVLLPRPQCYIVMAVYGCHSYSIYILVVVCGCYGSLSNWLYGGTIYCCLYSCQCTDTIVYIHPPISQPFLTCSNNGSILLICTSMCTCILPQIMLPIFRLASYQQKSPNGVNLINELSRVAWETPAW